MKSKRERQRKILEKLFTQGLGIPEHSKESNKQCIDQALNSLAALDSEEQNPCINCDNGWGGADINGVKTCSDVCERFKSWAGG